MITTVPFKIISIADQGYHLMTKLIINGKVANVIIDTGASKTVFDIKRIKKYVPEKKFSKNNILSIGMGTNKIKSEFTILKKMEIGKLAIHDHTIVLMDLSHVNKSYKGLGLKEIEGILGSDILLEYKAVIDYEKKIVKLKCKKDK